jgi:pimeloyl-ACP methyl ester carboxylesterase
MKLIMETLHSLASNQQANPNTPALVFLHGGGSSGWMWQPVVERLKDFYCVVVDLPEHGKSASIKPFSMRNAANHVAEVIRRSTPEGKAVVIGLSEGAQVGVELLAQSPEVVLSAILSSPLLSAIPFTGWLTPGIIRLMYITSVEWLKHVDSWIRLNMRYAAGIPDVYFPQFKQDFQNLTADAFVNLMQANLAYRMPSGLNTINAPVLVVVGSKEYAAMRQSVLRLAEILPHGKAVSVDLGRSAALAQEHNWALNDPDLFAEMVRAWVSNQPLPARLEPLS